MYNDTNTCIYYKTLQFMPMFIMFYRLVQNALYVECSV